MPSQRCDIAKGLRIIIPEFFCHLYISGFLKFCYLNAQISGCCPSLLPYICEFSNFRTHQASETIARRNCECSIGSRSLNLCHGLPCFLTYIPGIRYPISIATGVPSGARDGPAKCTRSATNPETDTSENKWFEFDYESRKKCGKSYQQQNI